MRNDWVWAKDTKRRTENERENKDRDGIGQ
jgi:hypothetical protein